MARYYGKIGFATTVEESPGIYESAITEKEYYGDLLRNTRKIFASNKVNFDIDISNQIKIIADPYAYNNYFNIRYAEVMGQKWIVTSADVQFPNLILTLGGLYNGEQARPTTDT